METGSTYTNLGQRVERLSTVQYAFFLWVSAFIVTLLVGIVLPGNTLVNAVLTAIGAATGVAVITSLTRNSES